MESSTARVTVEVSSVGAVPLGCSPVSCCSKTNSWESPAKASFWWWESTAYQPSHSPQPTMTTTSATLMTTSTSFFMAAHLDSL